jgi:hypothetical protein
VLIITALVLVIVQCGKESIPEQTLQEKYGLSDQEARLWDSLWVDEADSVATLFWGLVGQGEFEQAALMVQRYDDERMKNVFENRLQNLWQVCYRWPAAGFTEEPQIDLGPSKTVGFRTWGELLSGGFQRAVLASDSITVYFVFEGYWQTENMPLYAAVCCGDFGKDLPNWRPFPNLVFSVDNSEATKLALGEPQISTSLDGFILYLKDRTFGTFGI